MVPCYNEAENIPALVSRVDKAMKRSGWTYELILVDDGSLDETWARIVEAGRQQAEVLGERLASNQGMFAAWKKGVQIASGKICALLDADMQSPPESLPQLVNRLHRDGSDVCQGTRSSINWVRDSRYLSSRGLNWLLNLAFRDNAADHKSGFLVANRVALAEILDYGSGFRFPQTFVRASMRAKGMSISEVETLFVSREAGKSFLSNQSSLSVYARVLADFPQAWMLFRRKRQSNVFLSSIRGERIQYSGPKESSWRSTFYFASMPTHAWMVRGQTTKEVLERLRETQWHDLDSLREMQTKRLEKMLRHAAASTSYYRDRFQEDGIGPFDISALGDLENFPMLSKEDVRHNLYMGMFADSHDKKKMLKIQTSGSTGSPSVTYADRDQLEVRFASTLRALEWTGWRFGDRQLRLWHQRLGMSRTQAARERADAALLRRKFVPAFEMSAAGLTDLSNLIDEFRPFLIDGYAESLNFVAEFLAAGRSLKNPPKAFMSSAQILTASTRELLESSTGGKVFDKYGAREFSGIAYQCGEGPELHVMDESYVVEIVKDGKVAKPGEVGEVLVTDLNNFSTPMIRYRIGDLAVAADNSKPCACGRSLSRIGSIQGRTQALVFCDNGRWLPGTFFAHFFKEFPAVVNQFQIVQAVEGAFTLKVVKGPFWGESSWRTVLESLKEYVGTTRIDTQFVESIPMLRTGKRTPVISQLRVDFQRLAKD